jgi:hypothetical protein
VLVSLDFPRGEEAKAAVPNPARNQELSKQYTIEYFPSVILMTVDGVEYLRTSNIDADAPAYLEHIRKSAAGAKQALLQTPKLKEKFAQADDKEPVVREAIALLLEVPQGASSLPALAEIVRQGLALDPENKRGLQLASLTALVQSGSASSGENDLALTLDPANEVGLYEQVVSTEYQTIADEEGMDKFLAHAQTLYDCAKVHDPAKVSMSFAVAAYILKNERDDADKAKVFALKALEIGSLAAFVLPIVEELAGVAKPVEIREEPSE